MKGKEEEEEEEGKKKDWERNWRVKGSRPFLKGGEGEARAWCRSPRDPADRCPAYKTSGGDSGGGARPKEFCMRTAYRTRG